MQSENNKISIQQLFTLALISLLTPVTRFLPSTSAESAGHAGWLVPILAALPYGLIIWCYSAIFKNDSDNAPKGLADIYELVFGKVIGKAIIAFCMVWVSIVYFSQIRYYAERMVSTIFTGADMRFFIVIMMLLVFMALRGRIEAFGRFTEIVFLLMILLVIAFIVLLLPTFHVTWVLPATTADLIPSAKGMLTSFNIYGLVGYLFFIGDSVINKNHMMKKGKRAILFVAILPALIVIITLGSLGPGLVKRSTYPFFSSLKIISFLRPFDRLEAVLLSSWVVADFALIAGLAMAVSHMGRKLFSAKESKYNAAPVAIAGFVGGTFMATSRQMLELVSRSVKTTVITAIITIGLPTAALITGKLRKVI